MDGQTIILRRYRFRCDSALSLEEAAEALRSLGDLLQLRHGYPSHAYEVKIEQRTLGVTADLDARITGGEGFGFRGQLDRTATGSSLNGRIGPSLFSTRIFYSIPIWILSFAFVVAFHSGYPISLIFFNHVFREFFVPALIAPVLWLFAIHGLMFPSRRALSDTVGAALRPEAA